jgi:catechol 2,3-dioxygenase-like lactoylglutathione lyase family enzyme
VKAALHHVQVAIPPQGEERARAFYVRLVGLTEVPKPPALAAGGGRWLRLAGGELHLGVDAEFRAARRAHPALEVDGWPALRERLASAGVPLRDDLELPGRRRFADDPFGNRLEFIEAAGP